MTRRTPWPRSCRSWWYDEWLAADVDQALGIACGQRRPAAWPDRRPGWRREQSAHHWMTTLVPSKSNRNRTSSSPASGIACRSRARSSQ